jgi:site-specific DNA recombinase
MTQSRTTSTTPATTRCGIYTQKSFEEGLQMEFNSLDAQRESGEAFIKSQAKEGWVCVPDRYDDGGFTGGNIDRPALKRLLADVEAGKIDCVVVYKVDRLSRSLMDFSRLMEVFEKHRVSFVSVTQHFNSAYSMGRLTLNILLSFARFEREIISERTRDKMSASRRKGKYVGGAPVLGYDVDLQSKRLVVSEDEAERVLCVVPGTRGSVAGRAGTGTARLGQQALGDEKRPQSRRTAFTKTSLHRLLTNVSYVGKVKYKDEVHDGEQPAIVDLDVWRRAGALGTQRAHRRCPKPVWCSPQGDRALYPLWLFDDPDAHHPTGQQTVSLVSSVVHPSASWRKARAPAPMPPVR